MVSGHNLPSINMPLKAALLNEEMRQKARLVIAEIVHDADDLRFLMNILDLMPKDVNGDSIPR